MTAHTTITPPDLDRRLSRKIETGKTIQLRPADLDLLVQSGAIDTFRKFVSEYQRDQCRARDQQSRSTSAAHTRSSSGPTAPTMTSSGTTANPWRRCAVA